jgi:hypothetical protein
MCLFQLPAGERSELVASRATGLEESVVLDGETVITQAHIDAAPEEKRSWLAARVQPPDGAFGPLPHHRVARRRGS